jgi:hypothetical protein
MEDREKDVKRMGKEWKEGWKIGRKEGSKMKEEWKEGITVGRNDKK